MTMTALLERLVASGAAPEDDLRTAHAAGMARGETMAYVLGLYGQARHAYVARSANHAALDVVRRREARINTARREEARRARLAATVASHAEDDQAVMALVQRAISRCRLERDRAVLTARFVEHKTPGELARRDGVDVSAISQRVRRALGRALNGSTDSPVAIGRLLELARR